MEMKEFELGVTLRDRVTGFEGIAVCRTYHLDGCTQYGLAQRVDKEGKKRDTEWFDWQRLEQVDKGILGKISKDPNGGPRDNPAI